MHSHVHEPMQMHSLAPVIIHNNPLSALNDDYVLKNSNDSDSSDGYEKPFNRNFKAISIFNSEEEDVLYEPMKFADNTIL